MSLDGRSRMLVRTTTGVKPRADFPGFWAVCTHPGPVAQLVAHLHGMQGVRGSSPLRSAP
jgi:hypothetical protein